MTLLTTMMEQLAISIGVVFIISLCIVMMLTLAVIEVRAYHMPRDLEQLKIDAAVNDTRKVKADRARVMIDAKYHLAKEMMRRPNDMCATCGCTFISEDNSALCYYCTNNAIWDAEYDDIPDATDEDYLMGEEAYRLANVVVGELMLQVNRGQDDENQSPTDK